MMQKSVRALVHIRRGTVADKPAVARFTTRTFHWGDYLPQVWEHWAKSRQGSLLVAKVKGRLVGTVHVRYLGNAEAWLEGVRVHPAFRRRGTATLLIEAAHRRTIAKKCRVIRLETASDNLPARRAFERLGYRPVVRYTSYKGDAQPLPQQHGRPAALADLSACWDLWESSAVKRHSRNIVPSEYGWRWWELTYARLANAVRAKRVWVTPVQGVPRAFMLVRHDDSCDIILLVGPQPHQLRLIDTGRVIASELGNPHIFWLTPSGVQAEHKALQADLEPDDDTYLIYARTL